MSQPEPIPTLYVKSMVDKCNGNHVALKRVFAHARRMAPCLVIFEDLDSLVSESIRSHFLNEVDGLESNDGILMLGSTNHLDNIDVAIRSRPSRFDRKYKFDMPGRVQREMYARYWNSKLVGNAALEFPEEACAIIATLTEDFTFAYLKELFITTLLAVARGVNADELEWDVVGNSSAQSSTKGDETPKGNAEIKPEKVEETTHTQRCEKCTKCEHCSKPDKRKDADVKDLAMNSRQPSKAVVLSSATAYIKQLEKENKRLQEELTAMKAQNKTLQSLVKCDDCSLMNYARQWKIRAPV